MIPWSVIAARKAAETSAMPITVMAEAEKQAATNRAEATNVLAKADANAATTRAGGVKALGQAEAEVATLKAEARNKLSPSMIDYDLNLARINIIPNALAEAVKPIEKISDIRILSLLSRFTPDFAFHFHGGLGSIPGRPSALRDHRRVT
jgi:flotillin